MHDLDIKRRHADISVSELARRAGLSEPRVWRFLRPTLQPAEIRRLEHVIDAVAAERGTFYHPIAD